MTRHWTLQKDVVGQPFLGHLHTGMATFGRKAWTSAVARRDALGLVIGSLHMRLVILAVRLE